MARGLDVYRFDATKAESVSGGTWLRRAGGGIPAGGSAHRDQLRLPAAGSGQPSKKRSSRSRASGRFGAEAEPEVLPGKS